MVSQYNITLAQEGFYNESIDRHNMRDTCRVYLRNTFPPFTIIDSAKGVIDTITFTGNFLFTNAPGGTYYLMVKHRNSLETWSKAGGETYVQGGINNYNFTSAILQAYGNNLVLKGSRYCIYSGDLNNDGIVDASDLSISDNEAFNGASGYVISDVNGDRFVDASDLSLIDNNAARSIMKITPN